MKRLGLLVAGTEFGLTHDGQPTSKSFFRSANEKQRIGSFAGALPEDVTRRGLMFGGILCLTKIVPRDIDRILLTTYPPKRRRY